MKEKILKELEQIRLYLIGLIDDKDYSIDAVFNEGTSTEGDFVLTIVFHSCYKRGEILYVTAWQCVETKITTKEECYSTILKWMKEYPKFTSTYNFEYKLTRQNCI